jgi:hypothetical protein
LPAPALRNHHALEANTLSSFLISFKLTVWWLELTVVPFDKLRREMASKEVQGVAKSGMDPTIKPHISELPFTWANWHKHINWLNTNTVIVLPLIGVIASFYTPLLQETFFAAIVYYFITGLGITAGARPLLL